jgi:hypothetical protein
VLATEFPGFYFPDTGLRSDQRYSISTAHSDLHFPNAKIDSRETLIALIGKSA